MEKGCFSDHRGPRAMTRAWGDVFRRPVGFAIMKTRGVYFRYQVEQVKILRSKLGR